jgi:hypothetical protein
LEPGLELVSLLMDGVFRIPGLGIRFGLDPIIGLIPGLGDAIGCFISLYIVAAARRYGVSRATLARMGANIVIDYLVGVVPVVGDVFDVFWKSNQKNVALLRRHVSATPNELCRHRWTDVLFLTGLVLVLVGFIVAGTLLAGFLLIEMARWLRAVF